MLELKSARLEQQRISRDHSRFVICIGFRVPRPAVKAPSLSPDHDLLPLARLPFFKRQLARLLSLALVRLRARHEPSWRQGHGDGFLDGHFQGLEEGRAARGSRTPRGRSPGTKQAPTVTEDEQRLFADWQLPLSAALKKRIKADVSARLPHNQQPSAAQWKLILATTPTACVVAGAGSGKSTSLVLRVVVLLHYLKFDPAELTVVTFTRESRHDFIDKLLRTLALWQHPFTSRQARELVRTFHSRLLPMVRSVPGLADVRAFETLGAGNGEDGNAFDLRINDTQRELLNQCYRELHERNPEFRQALQPLLRHAMQLRPLERDHPDVRKRLAVIELAARRDEELCDLIEDLWLRAGAWPRPGVEASRQTVEVNGHRFQVHGHVPALDAWVVLGFDPREDAHRTRPGASLPMRAEWAVKRTLFQAFCSRPVIWLDSYASAERMLASLSDSALGGPGIEYRPPGEPHGMPLLDAFVATAGFIENLGLDVAEALSQPQVDEDDVERAFQRALAIFWPAFYRLLEAQQPPVMCYNRMFALFGNAQAPALGQVSDEALRSLRHLLVDEFQDVSPQIVAWLRASLGEIRRRGDQPVRTSLMAVGDDWQSIYGWRGSSPHYFMAFEGEFPAPSCTRVMLADNYRSSQAIIDAAEHVVRGVPSIAGKKSRAAGVVSDPAPVVVLDRDDDTLQRLLTQHYQAGDSILLLYRKAAERARLPQAVQVLVENDERMGPERRRLRLLSYHSAKGLQADAVFLLGDCVHGGHSPLKNRLYRQAGLGREQASAPYDVAQQEEALRLAYVAITRAARHCYWLVEADAGQQAVLAKASSKVDGGKPFFKDLRAPAASTVPKRA